MLILFPSNPIRPRAVDEAFDHEACAAKEAGFHVGRVSLEILLGGDLVLSGIEDEHEGVIYRGWLMKPEAYLRLAKGLNGKLLSDLTAYQTAYELPAWYARLGEEVTPRTVVLPNGEKDFDLDEVAQRVATAFGPKPVMVKDYVKSAKHRWFDACYIRDATDTENVKRVTRNFLDVQAESLVGGLCFRKFEETFKSIGVHSKTKQPLVNEWRLFMREGKTFYRAPYWAEGDYTRGTSPNDRVVEEMMRPLAWLPLVAVDVAEREDGTWTIIEINPGEASGVPEGGSVDDFYRALAKEFHAP